MTHGIPVIDLAPAHDGDAGGRRAVAAQIDMACRALGFRAVAR